MRICFFYLSMYSFFFSIYYYHFRQEQYFLSVLLYFLIILFPKSPHKTKMICCVTFNSVRYYVFFSQSCTNLDLPLIHKGQFITYINITVFYVSVVSVCNLVDLFLCQMSLKLLRYKRELCMLLLTLV